MCCIELAHGNESNHWKIDKIRTFWDFTFWRVILSTLGENTFAESQTQNENRKDSTTAKFLNNQIPAWWFWRALLWPHRWCWGEGRWCRWPQPCLRESCGKALLLRQNHDATETALQWAISAVDGSCHHTHSPDMGTTITVKPSYNF